MRYLGGKTKLARDIVSVIRPQDYTFVWEPFCGGGSVTAEISRALEGLPTVFLASDVRPELVDMWEAVKSGWAPPKLDRNLTDTEYQALRLSPDSPIRTFVGFGCSFGGKYWGGLARGDDRAFYEEGRRRLLLESKSIVSKQPIFRTIDFLTLAAAPPPGTLVYCDPPYVGTTGYGMRFDHDLFWSVCLWLARSGCAVYVSEFSAPSFCAEVWRKDRKMTVGSKSRKASMADCLFLVNP